MITIRRRLIIWLIRAYIRKMGKTILIYFAVGLLVFFVLRLSFKHILPKYHSYQKETIGVVGAYTTDDLPPSILYKISRGLTTIAQDGTVKPDVARYWKLENDGKTYIFYLKTNIYFSDGKELTSDLIHYDFSDVITDRPDKYTIIFKLKGTYSPFLVTVARPIFKKGFIGLGGYKIKNIELNGNFVKSMELVSTNNKKSLIYEFYPTVASSKTAFVLSDVSKIIDMPDVNFKKTSFYNFKNANVSKNINYKQLVTLFYNTEDKNLSSKTLREALYYTIPNHFDEGLRHFGPFSPFSFAVQEGLYTYQQDISHAQLLLDKFKNASLGAKLSLTIDTLPQYNGVAETISKIWNSLEIETRIQITDKVPSNFQVFLGEFSLPPDPDQYVLWHSDQINNITHYSNLRIDKLLEDGRQTNDIEKRKKIYADFQKYILSDPPASFLFFPYTYDVARK
ncbi:MAG: ABC transporter substrate-binding protein [Patescibacteria group bacterium]